MALIKCKECGNQVSKKADACPNCGYNLKKARKGKQQGIGCLLWIIVGIVGFFFISEMDFGSGETTPWNERDNWAGAYVMTQDWVKNRLVSPSTADFPGASTKRDHTTRVEGQKYRIVSYVDSQNRMGGTIRTSFIAEVEQVEEGRWRLISLDLE